MFDIAVLNAELMAKTAIMKFEEKFAPPKEKEDAKNAQNGVAENTNNAPQAQY